MLIPECSEYCDGNAAEFFCPECSAMFCGSCYDKEHLGNERKSQHGKLTELHAICSAHKHTLDYFNLTILQPMCVICRKENMQAAESQHHVVENIDNIVPKLRSFIEKKLSSASELISKLNSEITKAENTAKSTANSVVDYIKCVFVKLRRYLEESETELVEGARCYFDEFWEVNEENLGVKNAVQSLEAISEEGKLLLSKDARHMAVEFPSIYSRLEEMCNANERIQDVNFVVVRLEEKISNKLKAVIETITQSTMEIGDCVTSSDLAETQFDTNNNEVGPPPRVYMPGRKRFHENAVASYDEPNAKKQNSSDCSRQITAGFSNNSATRSAKLKSVRELSSPSKVRKRTNKAGKPPKSPARCSLPRSNQAWPSPGENVHRTRRGGELSKEFKKCDTILTELWAQDDSYPFVRPVDKRQSPDYYTIIKNPMDLSAIKEKLHSLQYKSSVDFVKDFRLMISNCRAYNQVPIVF